MNIAVYSAETSVQRLIDEYLPTLQRTADDITEEWTPWCSRCRSAKYLHREICSLVSGRRRAGHPGRQGPRLRPVGDSESMCTMRPCLAGLAGRYHLGVARPVPEKALGRTVREQRPHLPGESSRRSPNKCGAGDDSDK